MQKAECRMKSRALRAATGGGKLRKGRRKNEECRRQKAELDHGAHGSTRIKGRLNPWHPWHPWLISAEWGMLIAGRGVLSRAHPGAVRCHFLRQGKGRLCVAGCGAVARLDGSSCVYGLLRLGRCPQPRSVRNQKGACQPHCRRKLLRGTRSRASGTVALPVLKGG